MTMPPDPAMPAPDGGVPDGGALDGGIHRLLLRVYWEDTDAGGIVYHASYIRWMERGRTELLRALGIDQRAMRASGTRFVVNSINIRFHRPSLFDDSLMVSTQCTRLRAASLILRQRVMRGDDEMASAEVICAAIDETGRPTRLPASLRSGAGAAPGRNTA